MRKSKRHEQIRKSAELYDGVFPYYPWIIRSITGTTGNGHHGVFVVCRTEAENEIYALLRDSAYVGRSYPIARFLRWYKNAREGYLWL